MRAIYKILSLLLQYPTEEILSARIEIEDAVSKLPSGKQRQAIERFCRDWRSVSATEAQTRYVETFDLQKRSALYLTYYVHGDTRKRGVELVRLKRTYRDAGLLLEGAELPDYLPVMLEFVALAPPQAGDGVLQGFRTSLELLRSQLQEIASPYRHLIDAICIGLPRLKAAEIADIRRRIGQELPREEVGLEPFAPPEVMPVQDLRR